MAKTAASIRDPFTVTDQEDTVPTDIADDPAVETTEDAQVEKAARANYRRPFDAGRRPEIEAWLDSHGAKNYYENEAVLAGWDTAESLNNQARMEAIDEEVIERYVTAFENGDEFPALIAHNLHPSGLLINIDGNHRLIAAQRVGIPTLPVYVVTEAADENLVAMTYEANVKHGSPTTEAVRLRHGMHLLQQGGAVKNVAARLNVSYTKLYNAWIKEKSRERATATGLKDNEWDSLSVQAQQKLHNNIKTNSVLRGAVKLAHEANLGMSEITELVENLKAVEGEPTQQEQVIKAARQIYRPRIDAHGGGAITRQRAASFKTPRGRFLSCIGQVVHLPENYVVITATIAAQERPGVIKKVRDAIARLEAIAIELEQTK